MRHWLRAALFSLLASGTAFATTGVDLSDRFEIDGYSGDFLADEAIFTEEEERNSDSKWGFNNDINQIWLTWDKENLYVAVDGIAWDNNIILLFDYKTGGLDKMTELNSWRRNFEFSNNFYPDLFWATWDGNTTPQIWRFTNENQVEQIDISEFETVATFAQGNTGRSMEAKIPWSVFFFGEELPLRYDEFLGDSVQTLPPGGLDHASSIHLCAILTAGPDGTGGPDSAPDNFGGHTIESSDQVVIDNYAIVPLDTTYYHNADGEQLYVWDSTVTDTIFADGSVDLRDVNIKKRVGFFGKPPIEGIRFTVDNIRLNRPIVSPEEGKNLDFVFTLDPQKPDEILMGRSIKISAEVYDMSGRRMRTLFRELEASAFDVQNAPMGFWPGWDGVDEDGNIVPGGIYILRLVTEPGISRLTKAFSVVR